MDAKSVAGQKLKFVVVVCVGGILLDQISKLVIANSVPRGHLRPVIEKLFNIGHFRNEGAAFSMLANSPEALRRPFFMITGVLAIVVILWLLYRTPWERRLFFAGLAMVLSGALGNFIDRVKQGYVVDYLDFHIGTIHWAAFNVADVLIFCGVAYIILDLIYDPIHKKTAEETAAQFSGEAGGDLPQEGSETTMPPAGEAAPGTEETAADAGMVGDDEGDANQSQ